MGKIVKYCNACEESFAEKFGFCPICGQQMTAFEMNPLNDGTKISEEANAGIADGNRFEAQTPAPVLVETTPASAEIPVADEVVFPAAVVEDIEEQEFAADEIIEPEEPESISEPVIETPPTPPVYANTYVASAAAGANGNFNNTNSNYQPTAKTFNKQNDDDFHITVIEEKNVKQRNGLLLGATLFMLVLTVGGLIYSLFNHPLLVDAIGNEQLLAFVPVVDDVPMDVEETPKVDKEKGGGGGGGGREEKTETSQGRLATQTEKPLIAPDKSIVQKDFELKQPVASTQGKNKAVPTDQPYGDPNSFLLNASNGTGKGGGQGSGSGTGQGSGLGTGQGSGKGSGSGSGEGDGNGPGKGGGDNAYSVPPPVIKKPEPVGVTEGIKLLYKPQAKYTDEARTNNIQGTVTLRITFLPSGQVGSISAVKGLPYGLTDKAIEAARQIKFDPQKRNGVPIPVTKTLAYSFTIY